MHILQLIGGQSWPNFLPLLFFKPEKVTFLTSNDSHQEYKKQIQAIIQTCQEMGVKTTVKETLETKSKNPTIYECNQLLQGKSFDLINLTGGSKPMALAAHIHSEIHHIPAFYLDTRRYNTPFEHANQASENSTHFPTPDQWQSLAKSINVRQALKSQGFHVPEFFTQPPQNEIDFARTAALLRTKPEDNQRISQFIASLRDKFIKNDKFLDKAPLRNALKSPIITTPDTPEAHYLSAAAQHHIIEQADDSTFFLTTLDPISANTKELRSAAENNFKLLEGGWFELALYSQLREKQSFHSIEWSVEPLGETSNLIGETDLVAFNYKTLSLHFISCKTSQIHGSNLDHIQGLRKRADKEGGTFSKAELWLFMPKGHNERDRNEAKIKLEKQCNEQNVKLRIYTEEC